ncbi:polysaccharide deacetylase [Nitrogeniibacter mangrovi]|uniref:Polysaccharide deacetylase n=1 Tax=Nitrogeniibacter mangrovi TaxID=2016596 RepID=A0A6C1AXW7_9RHOO|nr:polysaccharide deacetylase [Nitrogeniibacter mangrovi]QID16186.1 polysaccharide deacetylase [Nitrogeniibacter mangrovi]
MLDVFFTIDVEIWCDGWTDIDRKFPEAYRKYILGPTSRGDYGLPFQLQMLADHGVLGTCFVEPLFSTRFGPQPLADIVGLIQDQGQDVQLHMHTEWVDESIKPLIADTSTKRQHLFHYTLEEQTELIRAGAAMLAEAGASGIEAFRAGSFGFNLDTLRALATNGIRFDSSYNATMFGPASGVRPGEQLIEPVECENVVEYPMTVFTDGLGSPRHTQLTSCSFGELESLLWQSLEAGRKSFVILSHNFELLNPGKTAPDPVVIARLEKLCRFFERHRDSFRTCGFKDLAPHIVDTQPAPLRTSFMKTGRRILEQAYRRKYS